MSIALLFVIFVLVGFVFHFVATWPGGPRYSKMIAWGSWLVAAIIWAVGRA